MTKQQAADGELRQGHGRRAYTFGKPRAEADLHQAQLGRRKEAHDAAPSDQGQPQQHPDVS